MKGFIEVPDLDTGERRLHAVSYIVAILPRGGRGGSMITTLSGGVFETSLSYDSVLVLLRDATVEKR